MQRPSLALVQVQAISEAIRSQHDTAVWCRQWVHCRLFGGVIAALTLLGPIETSHVLTACATAWPAGKPALLRCARHRRRRIFRSSPVAVAHGGHDIPLTVKLHAPRGALHPWRSHRRPAMRPTTAAAASNWLPECRSRCCRNEWSIVPHVGQVRVAASIQKLGHVVNEWNWPPYTQ
jgi:hypothetical protein